MTSVLTIVGNTNNVAVGSIGNTSPPPPPYSGTNFDITQGIRILIGNNSVELFPNTFSNPSAMIVDVSLNGALSTQIAGVALHSNPIVTSEGNSTVTINGVDQNRELKGTALRTLDTSNECFIFLIVVILLLIIIYMAFDRKKQ